MNAVLNPFAPGAGTPPPELAGRDRLRKDVGIAIARIRFGRAAKSVILVGLRGVGKTVLLDQLRREADEAGILTMRAEAPERKSLPALLAPQIRLVLLHLSRVAKAQEIARRGLRALTGLAKSLKIKYQDIEVGFDFDSEPGLADNGDLEHDLTALLEEVGKAAREASTAVVLFLDELQYLEEDQFGALIAALHRCAQQQLPVTMVGAGLPQLLALAGNAKPDAERLFDFSFIGPLTPKDARDALNRPVLVHSVTFTDEALEEVLRLTRNYPYFLQEWGKHSWDLATVSPITYSDVVRGTESAVAALDENFFRVRFDRTSPKEKQYLRAMAELGSGPHRSGDVAAEIGRPVSTFGVLRQSLITKGMVWSPAFGETAFTVPLFDEFMKRIIPGDDWRIP